MWLKRLKPVCFDKIFKIKTVTIHRTDAYVGRTVHAACPRHVHSSPPAAPRGRGPLAGSGVEVLWRRPVVSPQSPAEHLLPTQTHTRHTCRSGKVENTSRLLVISPEGLCSHCGRSTPGQQTGGTPPSCLWEAGRLWVCQKCRLCLERLGLVFPPIQPPIRAEQEVCDTYSLPPTGSVCATHGCALAAWSG